MLTTWTSIRARYGFLRPYNFGVALPFLMNLFILLAILVGTAYQIAFGKLVVVGTERFYFLAYLMLLFAAGSLLSAIPKVSLAILVWGAIEIGLGSVVPDLQPQNTFAMPRDLRFIYHPLLQRVPRPDWKQSIRYDGRNRHLLVYSAYLDDGHFDTEFQFTHNSLGLRGRDLTAEDLQRSLIFLYGGSTTYDWSVTQGSTWAEQLQSKLDGEFTVLNFGVPGHATDQHLVHTALYQNIVTKQPVCAIYYVGWNDIQKLRAGNLDLALARHRALRAAIRSEEPWFATHSPLLRLAYTALHFGTDGLSDLLGAPRAISPDASSSRLERAFRERVAAIIAINDSRHIRSVFIGQLLNRTMIEPMQSSPSVFGFLPGREFLSLLDRFNEVLREAAEVRGAFYIDAGMDRFGRSDFTDVGHFSAAGSGKFATQIVDSVRAICREGAMREAHEMAGN